MGKHKSVEARRLTALGTAVHNWSNVLFNGVSVADVSDMQTMLDVLSGLKPRDSNPV